MFGEAKTLYYKRLQKYLKVLILLTGHSRASFAKLTGFTEEEIYRMEIGKAYIRKPEFIVIIEALLFIIYEEQNNALALLLDCLVLLDDRNIYKDFAKWIMRNEETIIYRIITWTPVKELESFMFAGYGYNQTSPRLENKPNGLITDIIKEL